MAIDLLRLRERCLERRDEIFQAHKQELLCEDYEEPTPSEYMAYWGGMVDLCSVLLNNNVPLALRYLLHEIEDGEPCE